MLIPEYLWQTKLALKDIKLSKYYDQGYRINHIVPGSLKSEIAVIPKNREICGNAFRG